MDYSLQYTLFIILAPLATFVTLGILIYARLQRQTPETSALVWMMVTISGWLVFNTLEVVAPAPAATLFWAKVTYLFIVTTPVAWFAFALRYTGHHEWLEPARFTLFCIIPAITTALVWTNEWHHLLWERLHFQPVAGMLALGVDHGSWFWVHLLYGYALVFLGAGLITRRSFKTFGVYRRQSIWLMAGSVTPLIANVVYAARLVPGLRKDYTPISFAMAGLAFAVGIFRYRLFDLRPVARDLVVNSMDDAMLALDEQGRVVDLNSAAQRIIGLGESLIGQPVERVMARWPGFFSRFGDVHDARADVTIDLEGQEHHYEMRILPLTDRQGRVRGRVIVGHDITERKRAEMALHERTAELELRNAELDAFAQTVAHDLKSPVTAQVGYAYLLRRHYDRMSREDIDEYLDVILRGSRKTADIVDALLLLASVRQLEDIVIEPLDMEAIVDEALGRLSAKISEREAEIVLPDTWPVVLGHGPWVEEVWVNYVSNALKYGGDDDAGVPPRVALGYSGQREGEKASLRIDRSTNRQVGKSANRQIANPETPIPNLQSPIQNPKSQILFWVRDNGPGIPPEARPRLFVPFSRLEQARAEGHGLGLSIVQRIVGRLGGEVGVESAEGQGSTFYFTLPAAPPEPEEA